MSDFSTVGWQDNYYKKVYKEVSLHVEDRLKRDPGFDIAELKGTLETLYVRQGNDQYGRGELGDLTIDATIAAYEYWINELKAAAKG